MAKVDILNYISDSNILRSTYDTDTNELDITDVPQNLNSVITLGQGGGGAEVEELNVTSNGTYTAPEGHAYSPVNVNIPMDTYGIPYLILMGGANTDAVNYTGTQCIIDYTGTTNRRTSIWAHEINGLIPLYNFVTGTNYSTQNRNVQPLKKKDGSSKVKITCDRSGQLVINEVKYENGEATGGNSGWMNITADSELVYNFNYSDHPYIFVIFRRDENNTVYDYSSFIQYVKIEYE